MSRPSFDPPGSPQGADWQQQIESRIYFWRDTQRGVDVSLRNFIHTISQGRADIQGEVQPVYTLDQEKVPPSFLASKFEQSFRDQGFDAAALVMNGGFSTGTSDVPGFWARFAMVEGVGVWMMELTHVLTDYMDLYTNERAKDLNTFDNMDCSCGTHPTAYTKVQLGWLDSSAIVVESAPTSEFDLHSLGLVQPPSPGRVTAVQIKTGGNPLFVEARQRVDQYDGGNQWNWNSQSNVGGIESEGVIVYELAGVENPTTPFQGEIDPLIRLLTQTALVPGQSVTSDTGVTVHVTAALAGGFSISIVHPTVSWDAWSSVAEGSSMPGAPVTAVGLPDERFALFIADPNGGIYTASGNADQGWGAGWSSVAQGSSMPGAPVTAVGLPDERFALFIADPNGGIYTASGNADQGWGAGWSSVAQGSSMPGAPVTAVGLPDERFALFIADPNGGIYTASGNADQGWGAGWSSVAQGSSMPGAPVTAVGLPDERFALFIADPNGGIYTASGNADQGWGAGWSSVAQGSSMPGAPVTAIELPDERFALFIADPNGGIYTASGNADQGWGAGWSSVAQGSSMPGAPVTAVELPDERFALFIADPNGGIYTASCTSATSHLWPRCSTQPSVNTATSITPLAPSTTLLSSDSPPPPPHERSALFIADPNGGIYTASGNADQAGAPDGPASLRAAACRARP